MFTHMGSVMCVVGFPRVCGLRGDEGTFVKVRCSDLPPGNIETPSLMDGGANICIAGILELLVDVESIPPLPILVATTSNSFSMDNCCIDSCGLFDLLSALLLLQECYQNHNFS